MSGRLWPLWPAIALLFVVDLGVGSVALSPTQVVAALFDPAAQDPTTVTIVREFRLPKALTAALAGAALALAGLLMQTLFRNPLAGPDVLGVSAGASLGVALVVLASQASAGFLGGLGFLGGVALIGAAAAGAGAALGLILWAARRVSNLTLLIFGLLLGYLTSAIVTVLIHFSHAERIQAYVIWTFGSFGAVTWDELRLLAPTLFVGALLAFLAIKPLNTLLLGETVARSLGVGFERLRQLLLLATALLAGTVTAFCGPIAFIGVAVPHLARVWVKDADHRRLLPACALLGASVGLLADLLTQLPGEGVLPLNAVTALLGAPVILGLLLRRRVLDGVFGDR
jgi:iron complex transport system permease protein